MTTTMRMDMSTSMTMNTVMGMSMPTIMNTAIVIPTIMNTVTSMATIIMPTIMQTAAATIMETAAAAATTMVRRIRRPVRIHILSQSTITPRAIPTTVTVRSAIPMWNTATYAASPWQDAVA